MQDVAPRLWKALQDERAYQQRKRYEYARGRLSSAVAFEEIARSIRHASRAYSAQIQRLRERGLFG